MVRLKLESQETLLAICSAVLRRRLAYPLKQVDHERWLLNAALFDRWQICQLTFTQ